MRLEILSPGSLLALVFAAPRVLPLDAQTDAVVILAEQPFQSDDDYTALLAVAGGAVVSSRDARRFYRCRAEFLTLVEAA